MNKVIDYNRLIEKHTTALGGVFTYSDLASITNTSEKTLLPRRIKQLEDSKVITKFMRGVYVHLPTFDPYVLSQKLCLESYLSLECVLSKHLVIGVIPKFRITAIKCGRSKLYAFDDLTIEHRSVHSELYFGFSFENGINIADPEKALLDCLYLYQKGRKPLFNIYDDLNIDRLDQHKIASYLKHFKNPKFVTFVQSLLAKG